MCSYPFNRAGTSCPELAGCTAADWVRSTLPSTKVLVTISLHMAASKASSQGLYVYNITITLEKLLPDLAEVVQGVKLMDVAGSVEWT